MPDVRLLALATASPPHTLHQAEVMARVFAHFGSGEMSNTRQQAMFGNTGILTRQSVRPIEWYDTVLGWPERSKAYIEAGTDLFIEAAEAVLKKVDLAASDIDTVITVSSTGISTPSLEARAATRLGLRPDARRVPVFGLGCAGGVSGLSLASRLARAEPGSLILLVALELCSLSVRLDRFTKADIVAAALFGDGAAACLLRVGDDPGPRLGIGMEHTWPDTLGIMGWTADPIGLGVIFDRSIPPFVSENYGPVAHAFLDKAGWGATPPDRYICHPGGTKVIEALEATLHLSEGSLDHERDVLRAHGNMSAPTVLFILKAVLDAGFSGRAVLSALGPGFTASFLTMDARA